MDNHSSRFSTSAIDLCILNNIEVLCYPGHLTHILQGPDVVLNKPISSRVENWIENNTRVSGNSDMSRISFIAVVNEAVRDVCSKENVLRAYSATGLIPFNPKKVDISKYASSFASSNVQESPIKATCSSCMVKEVELHPLVRQGLIPKKIASALVYTPPPTKSKSRSKIVSNARIITSEDRATKVVKRTKD